MKIQNSTTYTEEQKVLAIRRLSVTDPLEALASIVRIQAINAIRDAHREHTSSLEENVNSIIDSTLSVGFSVVKKEISKVRKSSAQAFAVQDRYGLEDASSLNDAEQRNESGI